MAVRSAVASASSPAGTSASVNWPKTLGSRRWAFMATRSISPRQPGPAPMGSCTRHRLHLEGRLDVGERLLEVGLLVIDAGDDAEGGEAGIGQHVIGPLGAVVAAVGRGDGHHRPVGHLQRPLHLGEEGGEARAVEDVEAASALVERLGMETEREVALLLLGLGVEPRRGAVGAGVAGIGEPEQPLHQGRLAGAVGAEHREGADHPGRSHGLAASCPRGPRGTSIGFPGVYLSSGKSSCQNSRSPRAPEGPRCSSRLRNSTRRILPEMVLGRSENSSRRIRL